jgi:hypothetical protein
VKNVKEVPVNALQDLIHRLERAESLDRFAKPLVAAVGRGVRPRVIRNLLSGTYIGHPLHPLLTDVPIGAGGMSTLLDDVGASRQVSPSRACCNIGVSGGR